MPLPPDSTNYYDYRGYTYEDVENAIADPTFTEELAEWARATAAFDFPLPQGTAGDPASSMAAPSGTALPPEAGPQNAPSSGNTAAATVEPAGLQPAAEPRASQDLAHMSCGRDSGFVLKLRPMDVA